MIDHKKDKRSGRKKDNLVVLVQLLRDEEGSLTLITSGVFIKSL